MLHIEYQISSLRSSYLLCQFSIRQFSIRFKSDVLSLPLLLSASLSNCIVPQERRIMEPTASLLFDNDIRQPGAADLVCTRQPI